MIKQEFKLLEKIFNDEIEAVVSNRQWLPTQTKSKIALKLEAAGYIEKSTVTLGGRFPVKVSGWGLTQLGHMVYCENC